jgi:hypothetical protein
MNQSLTRSGLAVTGLSEPRRSALYLGFLVLAFALVLARTPSSDRHVGASTPPLPDLHDHAATPVRASSDPATDAARPDTRWILRSGRRLHGYYVAFGWDDPTDDETSDDPTDDDDGWEGLSAVSESEAPVFAWFQAVCCDQIFLETQSELLGPEPLLFTSFLTLERLRC